MAATAIIGKITTNSVVTRVDETTGNITVTTTVYNDGHCISITTHTICLGNQS